jgi:predicted Zn-dependent protease
MTDTGLENFPSPIIRRLEGLLAAGQSSTVLHFSLGSAWLDHDSQRAAGHFRAALELDRSYSAAWKQLGKALLAAGDRDGASEAWSEGIAAAEARGDVQAGKEMKVFLRRISSGAPAH